jgi:cobalt/nickel transport system permease protein
MPSLDRALQSLRDLDMLCANGSPLARRDARAQLLTALAFVFTVVSFGRHEVAALLPLALYPVVLAQQGRVPAAVLRHALAVGAPFALVVGLFNPWLESAPALRLGGMAVSAGWLSFASIAVRVALTLSAAVVLIAGTGMPGLSGALARLGVPAVLTTQLLLLHRYLFVLAGEAARMNTARQLRTAPGARLPLAVYASLLGHLLLRAHDRAARIHQAMLARGFHGALPQAQAARWRHADTLFVAGWCSVFALVRAVNLPQTLGGALAPLVALVAASGPGA